MKTIDLHTHTSLKPMLTLKRKRRGCWNTIDVKIDSIIGGILDSQSNLQQLLDGGTRIAVACLCPVETGFADRKLLKLAARIIRRKFLSIKQVKRIARGQISYNEQVYEELENLEKHPKSPYGKFRIKVINSMKEYDENATNTLHIIIAVEGAHAFYDDNNSGDDIDEVLENLEEFQDDDDNDEPNLLYVTLCHIEQNVFANHAYANKIFNKKFFIPRASGLSDKGKDFIAQCNDGDKKPILIDIKHMSLAARKEYYAFRKQQGYEHIPIFGSHVAFSGLNYDLLNFDEIKCVKSKKGGFTKVKYKKKTSPYFTDSEAYQGRAISFNPFSLNLRDEEIVEIMKSDGLMGIIIDERVVGGGKKDTEKEFISNEERHHFFSRGNWQKITVKDDPFDEEDVEEEENEFVRERPNDVSSFNTYHSLHFLNQIIHAIKVGQHAGIKAPEKHLAFGSDLDGFVNPLNSCDTATRYPKFQQELIELAEIHLPRLGINLDAKQLIEDVFYNNAFNFLNMNF